MCVANVEREREREREVDVSDFTALRNALDASKKEFSAMTTQVICTAILGSFKIWASRNCTT